MATRKSIKRTKAGFGVDGAVMAAAIGVQTASQVAQAIMNRKATQQAAKTQADATMQQAQMQSQAMTRANQNANELQTKSQEFVAQQNEANRDLQKQNMMNMQMLMGQENSNARKEQAKLLAKYGTNVRRKLKSGGRTNHSSTGELGFKITDGAEGVNNPVIPLQYTPDGGVVMMVHPSLKNHGERNSSGRKGFGVATATPGMPFIPKNSNLEMEGGEIFKAKPGQGIESVISKHKLPGSNFNPKDYYLATGDYDGAFNEAEYIKDINGIKDSGLAKYGAGFKRLSPPLKRNIAKARYGIATRLGARDERRFQDWWKQVQTNNNITANPEDFTTDYRRRFKTSPLKRIRTLKLNGGGVYSDDMIYSSQPELTPIDNNGYVLSAMLNQNNIPETANAANGQINNTDTSRTNIMKAKYGKDRQRLKCGGRVKAALGVPGWSFIGAGANVLGGIGSSIITNIGNNKAAGIVSDAYTNAANIMSDAYNRTHGIDMNSIKREDFASAPVLANIRSARYNINPQLETINRTGRELAKTTRRNTLSSAAAQARELAMLDRLDQTRSQLYGDQANKTEAIKQSNMQELNKVANENADRQIQANNAYTGAYLNLLQYNNDIENDKILGAANAQASGVMGVAQTNASTRMANAQSWGNTLANAGNAFATALNNVADYKSKIQSTLAGKDNEEIVKYLEGNHDIITRGLAKKYAKSYISSNNDVLRKLANRLGNSYNLKIFKPSLSGLNTTYNPTITTPGLSPKGSLKDISMNFTPLIATGDVQDALTRIYDPSGTGDFWLYRL